MKHIWLIGGTQESSEIAQILQQNQIYTIITVTTASARSLYPQNPYLSIRVGKLTESALKSFCEQEKITAIIDASHPYAVVISQLAIAFATQYHLPYLSYHRPSLDSHPSEISVNSLESLLNTDHLRKKRVLLTLGYQSLPKFKSWQQRAILFARVLPSVHSIEVALASGFTPERLIAFRPPLTVDLERALWQHWHIETVVTKASGKAGGEGIKRQVAQALGVQLIVIERPKLIYPHQTSDLTDILPFCRQYCQ